MTPHAVNHRRKRSSPFAASVVLNRRRVIALAALPRDSGSGPNVHFAGPGK